jgi:adenylate kinase family enzyme
MKNNSILKKIQEFKSEKIVIVGPPGSGKTTVGKFISDNLNIPLIEADTFFWKFEGQHLNEDELRLAVGNATKTHSCWVFEGHFKTYHSIVLRDADIVIEVKKNLWSAFFDYCLREVYRTDINSKTKF